MLGISASPRRGGNTDVLLDAALEGARSRGAFVDKVALRDLGYEACRECGGCEKKGVCIIRDDMRLVYKLIERADSVIIASPIFFGSITAQLKAMIDRFQPWWIARYVLKRRPGRGRARGYFISASAASGSKYFTGARKLVRIFFATTGAEYSGGFCAADIEKKGAASKDPRALRRAYGLGRASAQ